MVRGFGELEAQVMDYLWSTDGPTTVRQVVDHLNDAGREAAYTTVMTVMVNLHYKGWLTRERDRRSWQYTTVMSREEYTARLMREVLDGAGDTAATFTHFLGQMSEQESADLRTALRRVTRRKPR